MLCWIFWISIVWIDLNRLIYFSISKSLKMSWIYLKLSYKWDETNAMQNVGFSAYWQCKQNRKVNRYSSNSIQQLNESYWAVSIKYHCCWFVVFLSIKPSMFVSCTCRNVKFTLIDNLDEFNRLPMNIKHKRFHCVLNYAIHGR